MYKLIALFFILVPSVSYGGTAEAHNKVRLEFHEVALHIFLERGYCEDKNDCQRKELLLSRRTKEGISAYSYAIRDREVISELTDKLYELYSKHNKEFEMVYTAYFEEHKELVNKFFPKKTKLFTTEFAVLE